MFHITTDLLGWDHSGRGPLCLPHAYPFWVHDTGLNYIFVRKIS